jgi:uncharacterized protein
MRDHVIRQAQASGPSGNRRGQVAEKRKTIAGNAENIWRDRGTIGARIARHPKIHLVDSGVMAWLLNLTTQKIAQAAPAVLTEYGHLLETFAAGEILKQASWSDAPVTSGYFRTEVGDEVDLVLERDDGQVIAFEIKAGSRISGEDLRGLRQLKDRLGSRLAEAIILHTGVHAYMHDNWIRVLPLDRLWS